MHFSSIITLHWSVVPVFTLSRLSLIFSFYWNTCFPCPLAYVDWTKYFTVNMQQSHSSKLCAAAAGTCTFKQLFICCHTVLRVFLCLSCVDPFCFTNRIWRVTFSIKTDKEQLLFLWQRTGECVKETFEVVNTTAPSCLSILIQAYSVTLAHVWCSLCNTESNPKQRFSVPFSHGGGMNSLTLNSFATSSAKDKQTNKNPFSPI